MFRQLFQGTGKLHVIGPRLSQRRHRRHAGGAPSSTAGAEGNSDGG